MKTEQKLSNDERFELVLENSDRVSKQFETFNQDLDTFRHQYDSIRGMNVRMDELVPFYDNGFGVEYNDLEKGIALSLKASNKAVNDFFQKSDSGIKKASFENISNIVVDGRRPALDVLSHVLSTTQRDGLQRASKDHKMVMWENNLLALNSPRYATPDQLRFHYPTFIESFRDTLALNVNKVLENHTGLTYNPISTSVNAKFVFDNLSDGLDRGEGIGYGAFLSNNFRGSGSFTIGIYKIRSICTNGQMTVDSKSCVRITNSSEGNLMAGVEKYLTENSYTAYWDLEEHEQVVMDLLKDKSYEKLFSFENNQFFYNFFSKTIVNAVQRDKEMHQRAIVRASTTDILDMVKAYKDIQKVYKTILTQSDIEKAMWIAQHDPTIEAREGDMTYWDVINSFTRLANDPTISDVKSQRLQELGDKIMFEHVPLIQS